MIEKETIEFEDVENWRDWYADVAAFLSENIPEDATADVTVVIENCTENISKADE